MSFCVGSATSSQTSKYEFNVYRKPAITNVQIKPNATICPTIPQGFLLKPFNVCSQNYLDNEIIFLIDTFTENGHSRARKNNTRITKKSLREKCPYSEFF